ncbi:MAG: UDP-N-acetylmuramate dehydrogenase [Pseudomonadota bacterium]
MTDANTLRAENSSSLVNRVANTLALPCEANIWQVASSAELSDACQQAAREQTPLLALGEGSNVVLPPRLAATVIKVADDNVRVCEQDAERIRIQVGAGKSWHALVIETLAEGWSGLENLALIPGSVGAAPVQNIGAYGRELSEFVATVHAVDALTGEQCVLQSDECAFAYRESLFKGHARDRLIISSVELSLYLKPLVRVEYPDLQEMLSSDRAEPSPKDVFDAVVALRNKKLPNPQRLPNVGSFFKNPVVGSERASALVGRYPGIPIYELSPDRFKLSAAWMIEKAGLKGVRIGDAAVSEQHSLVLVNTGSATQDDVLELARHIRTSVEQECGVFLELEPRVVSLFDAACANH